MIAHANTDRAARAICTETCAFMGEPPCWKPTGPDDHPAWPNPDCNEPGCHALANAALAAKDAS